jgi:glycosyltransferase involved in cell wall biosynthesis
MLFQDEGLNWYGFLTPFSGYGGVTLEYATAIERQTKMVSIGWENKPADNSAEWKAIPEDTQRLILKPYVKEKIGIIKTPPSFFHFNKSQVRIGYTMVENTKIGGDWIKQCNEMDAIFVPSKYLMEVFKSSGVKVPVYAVRQGVNNKNYQYFDRPERNIFTFGSVGYMDDRKNWQAMVQAFISEFDKDEPVRLLLKNSNPMFGYWLPNDPRIKIVNKTYTLGEMNRYYYCLDCFLFPSRAEGAGQPPREAMCTGLPVIMTNWSGLADVCDKRYNYPIEPVAIDVPDTRGAEQPGFQARVDIAELMYWMRYVYEHQKEAKEKGKLACDWMAREWTWDACATSTIALLKKEFGGKLRTETI